MSFPFRWTDFSGTNDVWNRNCYVYNFLKPGQKSLQNPLFLAKEESLWALRRFIIKLCYCQNTTAHQVIWSSSQTVSVWALSSSSELASLNFSKFLLTMSTDPLLCVFYPVLLLGLPDIAKNKSNSSSTRQQSVKHLELSTSSLYPPFSILENPDLLGYFCSHTPHILDSQFSSCPLGSQRSP